MHTCTGGARPLVARARAPVYPSLATQLGPGEVGHCHMIVMIIVLYDLRKNDLKPFSLVSVSAPELHTFI